MCFFCVCIYTENKCDCGVYEFVTGACHTFMQNIENRAWVSCIWIDYWLPLQSTPRYLFKSYAWVVWSYPEKKWLSIQYAFEWKMYHEFNVKQYQADLYRNINRFLFSKVFSMLAFKEIGDRKKTPIKSAIRWNGMIQALLSYTLHDKTYEQSNFWNLFEIEFILNQWKLRSLIYFVVWYTEKHPFKSK